MTLLADPHAPSAPGWARAWGLPVWGHLLALGVILLLLVPVVGTGEVFLADEGAAAIQARSLELGRGWIVEHPLPEVDPEGRWYPVVNAERGAKGSAPLGKHPLYPVLAAGAARLGGTAGMVALSVLGTVAAAGLAAALARRIDPVLARPALWVVGLASPLLFDAFLIMGHTLGAALAAAAVLAAVAAVQGRRPTVALLVAPPVFGAVLLRSEALLFAAALALVAGALTLGRPHLRAPAGLAAVATVAGAVLGRVADQAWVGAVVGRTVGATDVAVPAAEDGFVRGRVDGFLTTWLTPGYSGFSPGLLALLVMVAALAWCGVRVRSRPDDRPAILARAAVAAVAAVAALVLAPSNVVPGLLIAFPLATAGLLALRRTLFDSEVVVLAGATSALFALAVLATQYAVGGSGEWGGRYFALALPVAVPVFLAALRTRAWALAPQVRRGVAAALVVCSAALSVMAVNALRVNHRLKADLVARIEGAGRLTGDPRPVVVSTWVGAARLAWPAFEAQRWLYVPEEEVAVAVGRLRGTGIGRFVLVTTDLPSVRPHLDGLAVVAADGRVDGGGRQILVLEG